jgi:4-hydroxythreonine-4-phosphate dehydrogenase
MDSRPTIGITMGDPVGIGPEIVLKALCQRSLYDTCRPLVLGDRQALKALNEVLKTKLAFRSVEGPEQGHYEATVVDLVELSHLQAAQIKPGRPTRETGRAMVQYITTGIDWAMETRIDALVTGPINKAAMHAAGFSFQGHTELLAHRTSTSDYVMMLAGTRLRVALVTIHVPLAHVSGLLTKESIVKTIGITAKALTNSFGISKPRLAVAALNPHGGEEGLFGDEEAGIIAPALHQARAAGHHVSGPYPADTLFYWALQGRWDAVLAMYHDQGLIPFKMVHFTDGVNTTLGLPIVRTSVDHGTAYDIAGHGKADPGSLVAAIDMAAQQAMNRQKT